MASVRVGDAEVTYSMTGSGTPVLLLHGAGASKDINWGFLTERLAGRFTVLAPDLPGSGETTDQDAPLQYDALIAQALAVAAVGGQRFHVVGYSLGAHLAAAVAAAAAQSVLSLTAIAGWVRPDAYMQLEFDLWQKLHSAKSDTFARFAVLTGSHPSWLASASQQDVESLVSTFAPILAKGTARQAEFIGRTDLTTRTSAIAAPTLVIGLAADRQVPLAHSHALHAAITGSQLRVLDAGHIAPWQAPDLLGDAVEEFLSAQPPLPS